MKAWIRTFIKQQQAPETPTTQKDRITDTPVHCGESHLCALPEELKLKIVQFLNTPDRGNLSTTNKRWNAFCRPWLEADKFVTLGPACMVAPKGIDEAWAWFEGAEPPIPPSLQVEPLLQMCVQAVALPPAERDQHLQIALKKLGELPPANRENKNLIDAASALSTALTSGNGDTLEDATPAVEATKVHHQIALSGAAAWAFTRPLTARPADFTEAQSIAARLQATRYLGGVAAAVQERVEALSDAIAAGSECPEPADPESPEGLLTAWQGAANTYKTLSNQPLNMRSPDFTKPLRSRSPSPRRCERLLIDMMEKLPSSSDWIESAVATIKLLTERSATNVIAAGVSKLQGELHTHFIRETSTDSFVRLMKEYGTLSKRLTERAESSRDTCVTPVPASREAQIGLLNQQAEFLHKIMADIKTNRNSPERSATGLSCLAKAMKGTIEAGNEAGTAHPNLQGALLESRLGVARSLRDLIPFLSEDKVKSAQSILAAFAADASNKFAPIGTRMKFFKVAARSIVGLSPGHDPGTDVGARIPRAGR